MPFNEPIIVRGQTGVRGFSQLITNEAREPFLERKPTRNETVRRIRSYLSHVLIGDGTRPFCPFVRAIEEHNGYFFHIFSRPVSESILTAAIEKLEHAFKQLSPNETYMRQPVDYINVIAAFSHASAMDESSCKMIETARNNARERFLEQGLMLAHMTPHHRLGNRDAEGTEPLYVSQIPVLIVRRMHEPDHVFMKSDREKAIYAGYFGTEGVRTAFNDFYQFLSLSGHRPQLASFFDSLREAHDMVSHAKLLLLIEEGSLFTSKIDVILGAVRTAGHAIVPFLRRLLKNEPDPLVHEAILVSARALEGIGIQGARVVFEDGSKSQNTYVRQCAGYFTECPL